VWTRIDETQRCGELSLASIVNTAMFFFQDDASAPFAISLEAHFVESLEEVVLL